MEEDILDGPAGGPEELRAIVARAGRHRRRSLITVAGIAAAAAMAAGAGIGYAAFDHGSRVDTVVAGSRTSPAAQSPQRGSASQSSGVPQTRPGIATGPDIASPMSAGMLTRIFTRTVGNVTVRGFTTGGPASSSAPGDCPVMVDQFRAEVSSPSMVGIADAGFGPVSIPAGGSILWMASARLGTAEGAPVDVVMVETGSTVTSVKAQFAGSPAATDQMAPVHGWVALVDASPGSAPAGPVGGPVATVTALGAGGRALATRTVNLGDPFPVPMPLEGGVAGASTCYCSSSGSGYVTPNQPTSGSVHATTSPPAVICAKPAVPAPGKAG